MKRVYISTPFGGDLNKLKLVESMALDLVGEGKIPIAPHYLLGRILNDEVPAQRGLGLSMSLEMVKECNEMSVHVPESGCTAGQVSEIFAFHKENFFTSNMIWFEGPGVKGLSSDIEDGICVEVQSTSWEVIWNIIAADAKKA